MVAIVRKCTVGVQPASKMFRMQGLAGQVVDSVLRISKKELRDFYFSEVSTNAENSFYKLSNDELGTLLHLTDENIVFCRDYYESTTSYSPDKFLAEFKIIWSAIDSVLKVQDIRRIGLVAELRYAVEGRPSQWLREKFTRSKSERTPAKFSLRFEERVPSVPGGPLDAKSSDFTNYIYNYYDSSSDADHPVEGHVNATVDVQRYFAPLLNGSVATEVLKLRRDFESAYKDVDASMKKLGAGNVQ